MSDEAIKEMVDHHFAAATELERCAAYANVLAQHLRSEDVSAQETAFFVHRFQAHGTSAMQQLAAADHISRQLAAQQQAAQAQQETEHATRH